MGYSHAFHQSLALSTDGWNAVRADVATLLTHAEKKLGIPLAGEGGRKTSRPFIGGSIGFNGVMPNDCESLHITRTPADFNVSSVKTRKKPYDVVVTAVLIYLESVAKSHVVSDSDGVRSDWLPGLHLALAALPQYRDAIDLPHIIREKMRWCGRLMFPYVDGYRFNLCNNDMAYVLRDSDNASFCFTSHDEALKFAAKNISILRPEHKLQSQDYQDIAEAQKRLLDKLISIGPQTGRNTPPPPVPISDHRVSQIEDRFVAYID